MQFSIGVEHALHSLFYMVEMPQKGVVGIKALAQLHGVSETYLSKIFTKLRKGGVVRSVPGVNGGYELNRPAAQISFWDIIEAIEGSSHMFQCAELRQRNILSDPASFSPECPCPIKVIMTQAEEKMREHLRGVSLGQLYTDTFFAFSEEKQQAIRDWCAEHCRSRH